MTPGYLIADSARTYPCPRCGTRVRDIRLTTGEQVTITDEPDPTGRIIPWPSIAPLAACEGRVLDSPIPGEDMWAQHACR
ncbi:MAG TPA: hypothetical protein VIG24_17150 [Acidimicrobiia bacterium]